MCLHCLFVAKTLPSPCVSTAIVAQTLPLPSVSTVFVFVAKTLPLPCVSAAFVAKPLAFALQLALLPPLPTGPAAKPGGFAATKILPIAKGDGFPTSGKGLRSNSENTGARQKTAGRNGRKKRRRSNHCHVLRCVLTLCCTAWHLPCLVCVLKHNLCAVTEMYVAHPFRLYGVGKATDITLAQQAYAERHNPCNDGWCQDIIQASALRTP